MCAGCAPLVGAHTWHEAARRGTVPMRLNSPESAIDSASAVADLLLNSDVMALAPLNPFRHR
jgi:hypothetical protein